MMHTPAAGQTRGARPSAPLRLCRQCRLPLEDHETGLCDRCFGQQAEARSVHESPVRPQRTAGRPSGVTLALLLMSIILTLMLVTGPPHAWFLVGACWLLGWRRWCGER